MKQITLAFLLIGSTAFPSIVRGDEPFRSEDRWTSKMQPAIAPLVYADQCLIISSPDGVAVVIFESEGESNVRYRFRCWDLTTEKMVSGDGRLTDKPKPTEKAQTIISAGPLRIDWSLGDATRGWAYWWPEAKQTVQTVRKIDFERIDLKRFVRQ